jgi:DNA ligase (NAD+)
MASLTKIKPDKNNLKSWLDKYTGNYILSDKEDGISIQLYKKSPTEYNLYSRGDGITGTDVSNLMKYIIHDSVLLNDIPDGTSIRGELIMSKANFNSLTGKQKNARNTVAGLVNTKQINASFKKLIKLCDFVAYEIIHPRYSYSKQFELLQKWKFNVVPHKFVNALSYDILCDYLKLRRTQSIYDIDGIVVADNGHIYEYTQGNPDYAFAFKTVLSDQVSLATIKDIIWDVSMDGYLKPKKVSIVPLVC